MAETLKLAAILAADVAGYSRLAGSDEDRTLARLRGLRSDLIDPTIAAYRAAPSRYWHHRCANRSRRSYQRKAWFHTRMAPSKDLPVRR